MEVTPTKCMIFLRDNGEFRRREGLGVHIFGRIPIAGEYISLDRDPRHYRVTHVHHTLMGQHAAELYVEEAVDMEYVGLEPHAPAAD